MIPLMLEQGGGRIVNIASVAGKEGNANACAYSSAKAGVIALTKSLGKELAQSGIIVNCVAPAMVLTDLLGEMTPEYIAGVSAKIPMGRFGTIEENAEMVAWLCSDACSFSTGAGLRCVRRTGDLLRWLYFTGQSDEVQLSCRMRQIALFENFQVGFHNISPRNQNVLFFINDVQFQNVVFIAYCEFQYCHVVYVNELKSNGSANGVRISVRAQRQVLQDLNDAKSVSF